MRFLRRLTGDSGTAAGSSATPAEPGASVASASGSTPPSTRDDEAERERDLLRAESARLADDLLARQLRYAGRSWTPPAQGGPRRADDGGADEA